MVTTQFVQHGRIVQGTLARRASSPRRIRKCGSVAHALPGSFLVVGFPGDIAVAVDLGSGQGQQQRPTGTTASARSPRARSSSSLRSSVASQDFDGLLPADYPPPARPRRRVWRDSSRGGQDSHAGREAGAQR